MVRPEKIYAALHWLKENCPLYRDIEINEFDIESDMFQCIIEEVEEDGEVEVSDFEEIIVDQECEEDIETLPKECAEKKKVIEDDDDSGFCNVTAILPENLEDKLIVNSTQKKMTKTVKKDKKLTSIEVAPGENKIPSDWLRDPNFDVDAFFYLHPDGKHGLKAKRKIDLTPLKYFACRTMSYNQMFARIQEYIFCAQQYIELDQVEKKINVEMQKGRVTDDGNGKTVIPEAECSNVLQTLPGNPFYWKMFRNELYARMEQYGGFHFFFTVSCGEKRWREVITSLLRLEGHIVSYAPNPDDSENDFVYIDGILLEDFVEENLKNKMTEFMSNLYLAITRIFDDRLKSFIKNILNTGDVWSYSYRIEFQMRGVPHAHGVFWLKEEVIEKYQDDEGEFIDEQVVNLIDEWQSCKLETGDEDLDKQVREVQIHKHTKTCKKHGTQCRFNFPQFPSEKTLIAKPLPTDLPEEERKKLNKVAKNVLVCVKEAMQTMDPDYPETHTFDDLLKELGISKDKYYEALIVSERGKTVILKRSLKEIYVNNYNPTFLKAWDANLDVQFCLDTYAVVTYISDYFTKGDAGMTEVLLQALNEAKNCNDFERLNLLKRRYFRAREVSVCEAAYKLVPGLKMKSSNVKAKFLPTGFPEKRKMFLKHIQEDGSISDDYLDKEPGIEDRDTQDPTQAAGNVVKIKGREGDYLLTRTPQDKYIQRPDELEKMCLIQFFSMYDDVQQPNKNIEMKGNVSFQTGSTVIYDDDNTYLPMFIKLSGGGFMKLRSLPLVVRTHKFKEDAHEQLYSEMMLYLNWRNEVIDLERNCFAKCHEKYMMAEERINRNRKKIYPHSKVTEIIKDLVATANTERSAHAYDNINPEQRQEDADDLEDMPPIDNTEVPDTDFEINARKGGDGSKFKPIQVEELDELTRKVFLLSPEQRMVFNEVIGYLLDVERQRQTGWFPDPPNIIVHGECNLITGMECVMISLKY